MQSNHLQQAEKMVVFKLTKRCHVAKFSLIETTKMNNLDLYHYIEYLLEMIPNVDIVYHPKK